MGDAVENTNYRYTPERAGEIERKWQKFWIEKGTFNATNPTGQLADGRPVPEDKMFVQDMFPFPSGAGLHVGHPLGYIATDVYARYNRMLGKNVLHTLGYDAFGLPAEQFAIQTGTHPRIRTEESIQNMERQLGRLGLGHDKRRAFATTDPEYYRWTQWIFLQIYNSWFDPELNKARPIATLEEKMAGDPRWEMMDDRARAEFIDQHRLVYRSNGKVNWCPGLGTVLANEEVTAEGKSERGNFPVFRKDLSQWMMRITAYADRLLDDLDTLDWPEKVKTMQRNWIGRSRGAQVVFTCEGKHIEVFTTRPDTLFGATYMVLAPEHPLVDYLASLAPRNAYVNVPAAWTGGFSTPAAAVRDYRQQVASKSDLERQENKDKTGVFLGVYASNPVNGALVPVFIADYVLTGYGTGAIMAVPAHDTRDYEFATAFSLPIIPVLEGGDVEVEAFTGDGPHINSANLAAGLNLDGMGKEEATTTVIDWLTEKGLGVAKTQYKLRDWLFARQRYWGEPFPIVWDEDGLPHALPESMLPIELPEIDDYTPAVFDPNDDMSEPHPPLARAHSWVNVELDLGDGLKTYRRDLNVMPQWAGSSWYQLRYIDPLNSEEFCNLENERYWTGPRHEGESGGVDLYVGGVEHAVLHLLYSRFWHKVLFDLGFVSSSEPYHRLFNQGYIQAYAYTDKRGVYVPAGKVLENNGKFYYQGEEVFQEYGKMGKSLKNSVSPDEICDNYGADTLRVYEMSMGPLDTSRPWATKDVVGAQRFLQRLWRLVINEETGALQVSAAALDDETLKQLHRTIAGVREDYAELRDNIAIAKLIEYVNFLTKHFGSAGAPRAAVEPLVLMVAPVAPHIAEELWQQLGHDTTLAYEAFPVADESYLHDDQMEIPVQINGKVKTRFTIGINADQTEVLNAAKVAAAAHLSGKDLVKEIYIPGRMVNLVVR